MRAGRIPPEKDERPQPRLVATVLARVALVPSAAAA